MCVIRKFARRKWRENKTSQTEHQIINKQWLNAIELCYIRSIEICRIFILYTGRHESTVFDSQHHKVSIETFLEIKSEPRVSKMLDLIYCVG